MKSRLGNLLIITQISITVIAGLSSRRLSAQTFGVLHDFSSTTGYTNWDGANPYDTGLALSGNVLYGMTYYGGSNGCGTVFSLNVTGGDFDVMHTFTPNPPPQYTNLDGAFPQGGLVVLGDSLYGTTLYGGTNGGYGAVFSVKTNGDSFTTLHSLNGDPDGSNPIGILVSSGGKLYGITEAGGTSNQGTLFLLNTDGNGFTVLHALTNSDGDFPYTGLLLSGNTLYGVADSGGTNGTGTIFSIGTDGRGFSVLHTFPQLNVPGYTNSDGVNPESALVISGGKLYGTTTWGGPYGHGTLFSLAINGSAFKLLHAFTGAPDGDYPMGLLISGDTIFGVSEAGGVNDTGTIYSIKTDGSNFQVLRSFGPVETTYYTNFGGVYPEGPLVLSGSTLYGMTEYGGAGGNGTVFRFTLPGPQLTIVRSGTNVLVTWPTNATPSTLQLTTNIGLSVWTNVPVNPVVIGGKNVVTNPITGPPKFFRLISN